MNAAFHPSGTGIGVCLIAVAECVSAQAPPKLPCGYDDKPCAEEALRNHPAKRLAFWQSALSMPLEQRIGPAPGEVVELIGLANIQQAFPDRPRAARVTTDFQRDLLDAFSELPPQIRVPLGAKLAGIYFVDDLGGTGYTTQIFDTDSKPVAAFVLLDPSVLSQYTANAWATWKENTPFKAEAGIELTARIETDKEDNRKNAIQYILLHELGHVLAVRSDLHPSWVVPPREPQPTTSYPYFQLSWLVSWNDRRFVTVFDDVFPQRKDVVYYLSAKLPAGQMTSVYSGLERTNFPTLYATTHPWDDFAEAFVTYVHTVLLRKPFEITIRQNGEIARTFDACWEQQRCAEKRVLLERTLARPGAERVTPASRPRQSAP